MSSKVRISGHIYNREKLHVLRTYPRFTHEEYEPADMYEYVVEWDSLNRRIDLFDASDYERFITEIA